MLVKIDKYYQFADLVGIPRSKVSPELVAAVRNFHETEQIEPMLRDILADPFGTPHGPTELADILTILSKKGKSGLAAFILKGRSFESITPKTVSHQIFRLRKLADLQFAILLYVGTLHDQARDEFIQTANDIGVDYTFVDAVDLARIAITTGIICPRDASLLKDGVCHCGYRASGEVLNILQREALKALDEAHQLGQDAGVVIMPTGSGKTRIAAIDSSQHSKSRILYVAHTHEILDVADNEFAQLFGKKKVVRGWPKSELIKNSRVHLSTIQSVRKRLINLSHYEYDYIIVDEFHHAAAASYRRMLKSLSPRFMLGLTATPFRGDKQDVIELCNGNVLVRFELRIGIETGVLAPFHYYGCFDNVDYSKLPWDSGYSIADLNKALIIPERDDAIIDKWLELAPNLPSIAFCCSRTHARRVAESFRRRGVPAEVYLGDTPWETRQSLITDLQVGDISILCTVDVFNEGIDIPFIRCLLFLRPTESKRIFFQQLGRGLRKSRGKSHVLVLDFIGNFKNSYRIPEYISLDPVEETLFQGRWRPKSSKWVLNLPTGCKVQFDEKVIDLFAQQVLDPRKATRHNIGQILLWQYWRTVKKLGKKPTRKELDRYQILHSGLYVDVFGSWGQFEAIVSDQDLTDNLIS